LGITYRNKISSRHWPNPSKYLEGADGAAVLGNRMHLVPRAAGVLEKVLAGIGVQVHGR